MIRCVYNRAYSWLLHCGPFYRTNVWNYPGSQTTFKRSDEADLLHEHPTPKNIAMLADAILDCSACGDAILDSFSALEALCSLLNGCNGLLWH